MSDTAVGVLSPQQLTDQFLDMMKDMRSTSGDIRAVRARVDHLHMRVDGLEAGQRRLEEGQQRLEATLHQTREWDANRDARIGELSHQVRTGFDRVDHAVDEIRTKVFTLQRNMDDRFAAVDQRFDAVDQRFESVEGQLKAIAKAVGAAPTTPSSS